MVINMGIINPRERLSAEDYLYLFWFEKIIRGAEIEYDEFQPTESMINHFNAYVKKWTEDFYHDPVHFEKPVDWDVERKKTPYFKEKLKAGHKFEVWAEQEFKKQGVQLGNFYDKNGQYSGENAFGLEIKHDMKLEETGNIYIEYQERLKNTLPWTNSGILKEDNAKYWIIGSSCEYYIFLKSDLYELYQSLRKSPLKIYGCHFVKEIANGTSKGFLMSRAKAKELCFASTISDFLSKINTEYYAAGYYVHGRRDCKYIANKPDASLQIYHSVDDAVHAGYKKCTDPSCFHK
ncbi:MAG: hypothetical protein HFJ01_08120 [Lachnospiraceae bacterium]|jgi:hypothetical protein|nr:hypothetical protein [Lachnospiraceae bacterium]